MKVVAGMVSIGGSIACCALLFVLVMVGLVLWYWRNQPEQQVSAAAPEPPIQATIEHPTAAAPAAPEAPVAPASEPPAPPSADA